MGKKTKIEDVIDERMQKHYFCLPISSQNEGQRRKEAKSKCPSSDERSIDKLLEFIELDEDDDQAASGTKRKKKKKKKGPRKEMTESVHTDQQQV